MKIKKKLILRVALSVFAAIVVGLWAFWEIKLKPGFIAENTRMQMLIIQDGLEEFIKHENRFPINLKEVVDANYLPKNDEIYFCLMRHHVLHNKELPYTECEFEFFFEPNEVKICIPEKVFNQERYKWLHKYYDRCMIATKNM